MTTDQNNSKLKAKSDEFVKKCLSHKNAAIEMLEESLPDDIKELVDISSVIIGKETFIEDDLKNKASDVVLYLKGKKQEEFICFVFTEHQSSCDEWIAFRLMKYNMLLLEEWMINNNWTTRENRANKIKKKLPIIFNLVCYNGTEKYTAPRNIWDCFAFPKLAIKYIAGDYTLLDLNQVEDIELFKKDNKFAVMLYTLKYIYNKKERIKAVQSLIREFVNFLDEDALNNYIYLKLILEYNMKKIQTKEHKELANIVSQELNKDGDDIMRTIAEDLEAKGVAKGIAKGKAEGEYQNSINIAQNMVNEGVEVEFVSKMTNLPIETVRKMRKQK